MSNKYPIGVKRELREPEYSMWYCGFDVVYDNDHDEEWNRDGAIAQYIGDGEFIDEEGEPVDMCGYDYLVKQ